MGKYFRVGQTVYDVRFGEGVVDDIFDGIRDGIPRSSSHPVKVKFKTCEKDYTFDGKWSYADDFPSLFQNPITIIPNEPIVEFESGELVWVRNKRVSDIWDVRYYSHCRDGVHYCFVAQWKEACDKFVAVEIRKFENNPLK